MAMAARDLRIKKTTSVIDFIEHRVPKTKPYANPKPHKTHDTEPRGRPAGCATKSKKHSHTEDRRTSLTIFERKQPPTPHAV